MPVYIVSVLTISLITALNFRFHSLRRFAKTPVLGRRTNQPLLIALLKPNFKIQFEKNKLYRTIA